MRTITVFTTGAYIEQRLLQNGNWAWMVTGFEDDTFINGEAINVLETAMSKNGLIDDIDGVLGDLI